MDGTYRMLDLVSGSNTTVRQLQHQILQVTDTQMHTHNTKVKVCLQTSPVNSTPLRDKSSLLLVTLEDMKD